MLNSIHVRIIWRSFGWLTRIMVIFSAAMTLMIALVIIFLRYWLLPDIGQYHEKITAAVSEAVGETVTIGTIRGDWEGFHPRLSLTDVRILDDQQQPALVFSHLDGSVSWRSLFAAGVRLDTLEISRPELMIRRDAQGKLFLGGLPISRQGGNGGLSDWLLLQSHMAVRDALIVWVDEQRGAPPLVLQNVNLHVDSFFSQHNFALRAVPPGDLSTPLDVRGDFSGASFQEPEGWYGQVYTRIGYTDVMAWQRWMDLPEELSRGRGALRAWLNIKAGKVTGGTADMVLHDLVARLAENAAEISLARLHGRAEWKDLEGGFEISTHRLAMQFPDGSELAPMDLYFRQTRQTGGQPAAMEIHANQLQLEKIAGLAIYLPLADEWRAKLDAYSPEGRVANLNMQWQGAFDKPGSYKIRGQFEDISLARVGSMPGFSGLSLDIDGNETGGKLNVNSHHMTLDAPGIVREPLSFVALIGQAGWQREGKDFKVNLDNLAVINDDLSGNLYGSYQTQTGALGILDLTASLTRGDIRRTARYIPLVVLDKSANDWLNDALLAGHTEDLNIRIKGNLSDFPLNGNKDTLLLINGHVQDASMAFAEGWPKVENINGEFLLRGSKLEVISPLANMAGARLQNVTVALRDITSADLALEINGEAVGENETFLQFIQQSPVRGYINGLTDGVHANGYGHLSLSMRIPLKGEKKVEVSGSHRILSSDIDLGEGVPWLRKARGVIAFTESGIKASSVSTEILGGAATINVQTEENGALHATVRGQSNMAEWRKANKHPVLNSLHGTAAWDADIVVLNKTTQLSIKSNLAGIRSTLPQPFAKYAGESMPLRLEKKNVAEGGDLITARLGNLINARIERQVLNGEMTIRRGVVEFGRPDKLTASMKKAVKRYQRRKGILLAGSLPELSIQGWDNLLRSGTGQPSPDFPVSGVNVHIEKLTGYQKAIESLQIDATRRGDGLAAHLSSDALNGELVWLPRGYEKGSKISARLQNLYLRSSEQPAQLPEWTAQESVEPPVATVKSETIRPGRIPALEIVIEDLQIKNKQFGRFELVGHPDGKDWRVRRLNITNVDGSLSGDGVWHSAKGDEQTQVNLMLKLGNVGNTLARYGYPNTVKGGSGKLAANLSWAGTPGEFSYASLNGTLNLDTGKGRFLQMDPGAGKLLSILSLQTLPSHIALDFDDVFSKGFQFERIKGNATIKGGEMSTQDLFIDGSAAKVALVGSVNLNDETQDLRVKVLPTVGESVSLISAFAAGPAAGVGTLIVSKILGDPLDKLVAFEYNVTGTWGDPNVVKVVRAPASPPEE